MANLTDFRTREQFLDSLTASTRAKMEGLFEDMDKGTSNEKLGDKYKYGCIQNLNVGLDSGCFSLSCSECWTRGCRELREHFAKCAGKSKITVEFHLNGKATTALIKEEGKVIQKGIAKQHVDDKYDAGIGMMWALARALKVEPADLVDIKELLEEQSTMDLIEALHTKWCK